MKGYPKSRFDLINNTNINEIATNVASGNSIPLMMATYTSDKGKEDWELITSFENFTKNKGGLSFTRHGQSQLTVAEILRNGAAVVAKRMVSADAKLANATVNAIVVSDSGKAYIYYYATSNPNAVAFNDAVTFGYNNFDSSAEDDVEDTVSTSKPIPLFTVAAVGRGVSGIKFRLVPEYFISKQNSFLKYSFEVTENTELLESIMFTMNPDVNIDGVNQSLQAKINNASSQVKVKLYEDGILKLVDTLSKFAKQNGELVSIVDLVNADFINGLDKKGLINFGDVVYKSATAEEDGWTAHKPASISTDCFALDDAVGIPLENGSYGAMGMVPMANTTEYEKLLLGAWGANKESSNFDPSIYDLDNYKIDAVFDCGYPVSVKNAIIDLADFRGDFMFLSDLGKEYCTGAEIISAVDSLTKSKFDTIYHNFFDINDPYSKKQITVTMPFLLVSRLINHISTGVGKPFAGIANGLTFPEIIDGTINYVPVTIPGEDQKQNLVDSNINYISYYDGIPVMETMYTNDDAYSEFSFAHNIMGIQEIIKLIRSRCPKTRYTFLDGDDLESYINDANEVINQYKSNFAKLEMVYMADERYETNNIFYAVLKVKFKKFVQEEYFKVIAIDN